MFCSNCGKQINDDAKFCEYCGSMQSPVSASCIKCGKTINYGAKFCEHCGATQTPATIVVADSIPKTNSKYTQQEQTNIVGIAATLLASIAFEKEELKRIAEEGFRDQPSAVDEIASWNKDLVSWMQIKQAKIAFVQNDLKENLDALDVLFATTKLIPNAYRSLDKLMWLHKDMSTSEHDIERAIDLYNHKETSDLLRNMKTDIEEVKGVLALGFTAVYSAIQENNAIQEEILSNQQIQQDMMQSILSNQSAVLSQQSEMITSLGKIRKSTKIGNFLNVGSLIQNHNRNKMISQIQSDLQ